MPKGFEGSNPFPRYHFNATSAFVVPRVSAIDDVAVGSRAIPYCLQKRGLDTLFPSLYIAHMSTTYEYEQCVAKAEQVNALKRQIEQLQNERDLLWKDYHKFRDQIIYTCQNCGHRVIHKYSGLTWYKPAKTDPNPMSDKERRKYRRWDCLPCGHVNALLRDEKLDSVHW